MTHILIQIWRWLMQPEGLRFGDWNLLKIILYTVFSFIVCLVILFAKSLQHSTSLQFKAHTTFFILAITSLYSFFFVKAVNGKPDVYSLIISCASFAIAYLGKLSADSKPIFSTSSLDF
ncbi:unnamed protein product [Lathyrus oleraceus]